MGASQSGKTAFMNSFCDTDYSLEAMKEHDCSLQRQIEFPLESTVELHRQLQGNFLKKTMKISAIAVILVNLTHE